MWTKDGPLNRPELAAQVLQHPLRSISRSGGPINELDAVMAAIRETPWTVLVELKGNPDVLKKIDDAEALLATLRKTLSS